MKMEKYFVNSAFEDVAAKMIQLPKADRKGKRNRGSFCDYKIRSKLLYLQLFMMQPNYYQSVVSKLRLSSLHNVTPKEEVIFIRNELF